MDYTREQRQAIYLRGSDIMVSAGAGAGKTRVLVNRIAELIMDEKHPVEADALLVMTFTNAAAAEMKERIEVELQKRLDAQPENQYLRLQMRKLRQADISTVHSFCNRLIRTHYVELALDPSFRIGEEGELFLLRREAMEELLEEAYQSGEASFLSFAESYAPGKSDDVLEEMIENLYKFLRGFPSPETWLAARKEEMRTLAEEEDWENCRAVRALFEEARRQAMRLSEAIRTFSERPDFSEIPEKYESLFAALETCMGGLSEVSGYDNAYAYLKECVLPTFPRAKKEEKAWGGYEPLKALHQKCKEELERQREEVFPAPAEEVRAEARKLYPLFLAYITLAQRFEALYFARKKEKNVYDFDDLEHLALALLVEEYGADGTPRPSEVARQLRGKYKMLFVDEYQDTNLVQETILSMLTGEGANTLFTVGDVKQSIYRFRQARPDLFVKRYESYRSLEECQDESGRGQGVAIELRDNFRSAPGVLHFTNYIFSQLMERDFGGVDYDERTWLRPGEGGPMAKEKEVSELLLFAKPAEMPEAELPADLLIETAMIAKRIAKLRQEGYAYSDMVILLRSGAGRMEPMAEFLNQQGIPTICESKTGYFQTREIRLIMNYLAIVDNVYQDIPMASVLLSAIGGFTEAEVVKLRLRVSAAKRGNYTLYDLLLLYADEGEDEILCEKIERFLTLLHKFRRQKKELPLGKLLWNIYQETGIYCEVQLMPEGERRKENLLMLLKKAEDYENTVFKGLFYFNRYMERLRSYEVELGAAGAGESGDVVRIMTIHKSKGLEFPVVFASGLAKRFNRMDLNEQILMHPDLGIGMECMDTALRLHHPSIQKQAIRQKLWKDTLEEEMRILYVAMTRAERKLILTGVLKEEEFLAPGNIKQVKWQAKSLADWVVPILFSENAPEATRGWLVRDVVGWEAIRPFFEKEQETDEAASLKERIGALTAKEDTARVRKAFSFSYPNREATVRKRKYSVSELKMLGSAASYADEAYEENELLPELFSTETEPKPPVREPEPSLPEFLKEREEILPTERGTIVHRVMELLPFAKIETKKQLFSELSSLQESYPELSKVSAKGVYRGAEQFLFSEQGERVRRMDRAGNLKKELPFTIGLPTSCVRPDWEGEETVVLQGVIDLCGIEEGAWWLYDYKTDYIPEGGESKFLDRYRNQMLYYKTALEQLTDYKVAGIYLYSFSRGAFFPVTF